MNLTRVGKFGKLIVYRRDRKHEVWVPLYIVSDTSGKILGEFKRKPSAIRWAKEN